MAEDGHREGHIFLRVTLTDRGNPIRQHRYRASEQGAELDPEKFPAIPMIPQMLYPLILEHLVSAVAVAVAVARRQRQQRQCA